MQKAHGLQLIGVVNKNTVLVTLVDLADLIVKLVLTTGQDRQTIDKPIALPLAHARGVE